MIPAVPNNRYDIMMQDVTRTLPAITETQESFNKSSSQLKTVTLDINDLTPIGTARHIVAAIDRTRKALKESEIGAQRKEIDAREKRQLLTTLTGFDAERLEVDLLEIDSQLEDLRASQRGAIRKLAFLTEQYRSICDYLGVDVITEEMYESDQAKYHVMRALSQALAAARARGGLIDEGNFIYIDPSGEHSPWEVSSKLAAPIITDYKKSHPLMRWIGMRDINIGVGSKFKLKRGDQVVASSFGTPMIVARDDKKRRYVALAFDIRNSDLPLRVAFPVLIINMIDYFQLDEGSLIQNYTTGQTWSVKVAMADGKAEVITPKKKTIKVPIYNGQAIVYGDQAGFYTLKLKDNEKKTLAANLSDPEESRIGPKDLQVSEKEVTKSAETLFFDRKELWIWALLIVLGILLLEWWTYNRRVTV